MAKKGKHITPSGTIPPVAVVPAPAVDARSGGGWLYDFRIQALIIAVLAIGFYCNTWSNDYALDDTLVINQNAYVLEGFAGIPDILTKDAYDSYYRAIKSTDPVAGGRYRPLSMVTFAIEQQFFGAIPADKVDSVIQHGMSFESTQPYDQQFLHNMHIRHLFNVLWFTLSVIVLLYFLRQVVFKNNHIVALLAAVLFTIHPLHTEVVANVKSRDEIMSLLFICLTFILAFRYTESRKKWRLGLAMGSLFLALLSKEYAVTLLVLLPLAFCLFNKESLQKSIVASLPYIGVIAVYALIRLQMRQPGSGAFDTDILINPYAYASATEKLATEIATSLNYLKLLIFPHPLSSDYSYNQIPYKDFANPLVWLSLIVHLGLVAAFFYLFRRRSVLSFAIAWYLLSLLMVCNIVFDIGATMGERLVYNGSVGFVIAVACLLYNVSERIKPVSIARVGLSGLIIVLIVMCGFKTIERNAQWKNDYTLFTTDIKVVPNSLLVNSNVAYTLINRSDFETDEKARMEHLASAVEMLNKAIAMQPANVIAFLNKGVAFLKLRQPDSVITNLDKVRSINATYTQLPELYYHAGEQFYGAREYRKAVAAWQVTLKLNPGYAQAQNSINTLIAMGLLQ